MIRRPPYSPLFPKTTLFESRDRDRADGRQSRRRDRAARDRWRGHRLLGVVFGAAQRHGARRGAEGDPAAHGRSEEHTSELQSRQYLVCRLLLEKKKNIIYLLCYSLSHVLVLHGEYFNPALLYLFHLDTIHLHRRQLSSIHSLFMLAVYCFHEH